jgi:hypothetical protein
MKRLILISTLLGLITTPALANAATFEFSYSDALAFKVIDAFTTTTHHDDFEVVTVDYGDGAFLTGDVGYMLSDVNVVGHVAIGNDSTIDLSGKSNIDVRIFNDNNQDWEYRLFAYDGSTIKTSPWTPLSSGASAWLSLDISSGFSPGGIGTDIAGIQIINDTGQADKMHTSIIPEPATLSLLGLGSLVMLRKRRV